MDMTEVGGVLRDGINVALRVGGPMLILGMAVGVFMALIQAVTQIHEQSLSFVLKLAVVVLYLMLGGGWMLRTLQEYTLQLFALL